MTSIYLCGPIAGLSYAEATEWRGEATDYLTAMGLEVYDPMRGKEKVKEAFGDRAIPHNHQSFEDPFKRDMHDLAWCDYVFVYFPLPAPSVGSLVEIGVAYGWGKHIIVVTPEPEFAHPFIKGVATVMAKTLEEGYEAMMSLLPVEAAKINRAPQVLAGEWYSPQDVDTRRTYSLGAVEYDPDDYGEYAPV